MILKSIVVSLCLLVLVPSAQSLDFLYKGYSYPTETDSAQISGYSNTKHLDVCCHYPTRQDVTILARSGFTSLAIRAGHFPTVDELAILSGLSGKIEIHLSEVFPSIDEIAGLNNSNVSKLVVYSQDFPTLGEVQEFNKFNINFEFHILKKEYPLPEHMVIIDQFKPEVTVGFYNRVPPGPGYANFFNNLRTRKLFVILEQFPWSQDYIGLNMLKNSRFEIRPDERLMAQDIEPINSIQSKPVVHLDDSFPVDGDFMSLVKKIEAKNIIIEDDGTGTLMSSEYRNMTINSPSPITFKFDRFY